MLWFFTQQTQNICITFIQCWSNVEDAGPALYESYTNVLCLLDRAPTLLFNSPPLS